MKTLVTENHALRSRVHELEQELAQAQREAQDSGLFHEKQLQIRGKIEQVLKTLDALGEKHTVPD